MKTAPAHANEPNEAEIQHQAYLLWQEGGCRPGRELDDWTAARELLRHIRSRAPVKASERTAKKNPVTAR